MPQDGGEYCAICYTDPLKACPCVFLKCGHTFHAECLREKLSRACAGGAAGWVPDDLQLAGPADHVRVSGVPCVQGGARGCVVPAG